MAGAPHFITVTHDMIANFRYSHTGGRTRITLQNPHLPRKRDEMSAETSFAWDDPLRLDEQLSDEERAVRDAAHDYCQSSLQPRITLAAREERFDRQILTEMGSLGFLGATLPESYGGSELSHVAYGLITREVERVDSGYRSAMSVQS